ncbi:MAG TPA: glycosyltransferase family 4 protein [Acidimicrobiales bacterium]|jgi:glycosyltransferase involved in cell wall biosynthesis|nr:glycosyltransferase family 4 protein [Acidimicrobiales bacterium]
MSGVHQFVPLLHRYDAVGEHTRALRHRLTEAGITSRIYTELPDPDTAEETRPYLAYPEEAEPGDVLVYQFATESVMARWLAARPEPLVVNYHSATPPGYFIPWNNGIARLQVQSLLELADIAPHAALGIAVSEFDAAELRAAGCATTVVIPVANVTSPPIAPDPETLERLAGERQARGPGASWLSVGRLAPNKGHHQVVAALFVARMTTDPGAHLTLVGTPSEPNYAHALRRFANSLGLADAVDFVSGIADTQLAAYYRASDVLVMLSDHEGFGVPLIEAMGHGVPVVAYDAGAVAEILGDAGVLLGKKHPRHVASAVHRLLADPAEVARLVARGRERVEAMDLPNAGNRLVAAVRALSDPVPVTGGSEPPPS